MIEARIFLLLHTAQCALTSDVKLAEALLDS